MTQIWTISLYFTKFYVTKSWAIASSVTYNKIYTERIDWTGGTVCSDIFLHVQYYERDTVLYSVLVTHPQLELDLKLGLVNRPGLSVVGAKQSCSAIVSMVLTVSSRPGYVRAQSVVHIASVSSSGVKNAVWKGDGEPKKKVLKLGQSAIWRKPLISSKKKDSVLRASLKVPDFTISVYGSSFNNLFLFCLSLASLLSLSMYWHLRQDEMPRNRRRQQETRTWRVTWTAVYGNGKIHDY